MPLRVGQLASAGEAIFPQDHNQQADIVPVIVASLITQCWQYAYAWGGMSYTPIYTLTIAALSLFLALLCLTPFSRAFRSYTDYILSVLWIIAFGQLLGFRDYCSFTTGPASCSRRWKAATAFSFISSLLWLATAVYVSHA